MKCCRCRVQGARRSPAGGVFSPSSLRIMASSPMMLGTCSARVSCLIGWSFTDVWRIGGGTPLPHRKPLRHRGACALGCCFRHIRESAGCDPIQSIPQSSRKLPARTKQGSGIFRMQRSQSGLVLMQRKEQTRYLASFADTSVRTQQERRAGISVWFMNTLFRIRTMIRC